MDEEQFRLKVAVDGSQVAPEMNNIRQKVEHGTKEAHKGFLHASNGAKEFHKAIHEISNESPIMGFALKAAFSPIGAMFTGATLAAMGFKSVIEEVTVSLDRMRDENAKAFGNPEASARSVAQKIRQIDQNHANFVSGQLAVSPGDVIGRGLSQIESFFMGGAAKYPVQTDAERSLLTGSQRILKGKASALMDEIAALKNNAKNPTFLYAAEEARSREEQLRAKVAALTLKEPTLLEQQREDVEAGVKGHPINLRQVKTAVQFGLGVLPKGESPGEQLKDLRESREMLKKAEAASRELAEAEKRLNDELKKKYDLLASINAEQNRIQKQMDSIPKSELVAGSMNVPLGPFGSIPVFMPSARLAPGQFNQSAIISNVLQQLQSALSSDGVPVSINVRE